MCSIITNIYNFLLIDFIDDKLFFFEHKGYKPDLISFFIFFFCVYKFLVFIKMNQESDIISNIFTTVFFWILLSLIVSLIRIKVIKYILLFCAILDIINCLKNKSFKMDREVKYYLLKYLKSKI